MLHALADFSWLDIRFIWLLWLVLHSGRLPCSPVNLSPKELVYFIWHNTGPLYMNLILFFQVCDLGFLAQGRYIFEHCFILKLFRKYIVLSFVSIQLWDKQVSGCQRIPSASLSFMRGLFRLSD